MKNGKRERLSRIFVMYSAVFIILLCVILTAIGIGVYRRDMYSSYYDYADTLNTLSEKVGITLANLSILKNNTAKAIRFTTLDAICKALDCDVSDILSFEPDRQP